MAFPVNAYNKCETHQLTDTCNFWQSKNHAKSMTGQVDYCDEDTGVSSYLFHSQRNYLLQQDNRNDIYIPFGGK